jgi:hypothetical protein
MTFQRVSGQRERGTYARRRVPDVPHMEVPAMVIRRVSPLSCARIAGALYALIGLVVGTIFSLAALAGALASNDSHGAAFGALFGIGAVVLFPVMYGLMGFLGSLLVAWLYNLLAGMVGGVEVELL